MYQMEEGETKKREGPWLTPRYLVCMEVTIHKDGVKNRKCAWRWCGEDLKFGWGLWV